MLSRVRCGIRLTTAHVVDAHDRSVRVLVGVFVRPVSSRTPTAAASVGPTTPSAVQSTAASTPVRPISRTRRRVMVSPETGTTPSPSLWLTTGGDPPGRGRGRGVAQEVLSP